MLRLSLIALALVPGTALAQAYQCRAPERFEVPGAFTAREPRRALPIRAYSLVARWSPEWCRSHPEDRSMQCNAANGRFGFILHGFWPEGRPGASPQWCAVRPAPDARTLREHLCMTPNPGLLAHEWAKRGSCMARTPRAYFRSAAVLWRSIRWPDADSLSRRDGLTVGELRAAFLVINPEWRGEQLVINTSRTGWLTEVRLCYRRDFMPGNCARASRGAPDSEPLRIWRGL